MSKIIIDFIIIASGILGYFLSISLSTTSFYKSKSNNYLSLSVFLLTSITLLGWHDAETGILEFLQGIMWEFLVPVTIFTYFLIQIEHNYYKQKWYKWLYFPFFSTLIIETFLHLDFNFKLYNSSFNEDEFAVQLFYALEDTLSIFCNFILIFWSRQLIKKTKSISNERKRWLLRLNLYIISIVIIWILSGFEDFYFNSSYVTNLLWVILSFLSWWLLYYGVFRLQIVIQKDEIHNYLANQKIKNSKIRGKKSTYNSKFILKLYQLMDDNELYKNPLLSRLDLANELDISEGYLSQIINSELNKSVIQFVNEYRIKTSKILLHDPAFNKYSIEAIGMEAGFKSKSAFYAAFKTDMNLSPGAYRKLQKQS